jgi:cysteine synthase A
MNIDKLIGNTPMIKIKIKYKGKEINVFNKLEYYNYTGSIKD